MGYWSLKNCNLNSKYSVGEVIDSFNGVAVYFNGGVNNVEGRNISPSGYNCGLKYQCVEFVKRYYYEYLNHKMPDTYGHAKDFFIPGIPDGELNTQRNLLQYKNPSFSKPMINDIIIFAPSFYNRYGHVAIISKVSSNKIEIIQQNPGPFSKSRRSYQLTKLSGLYKIQNSRIIGWLRKS